MGAGGDKLELQAAEKKKNPAVFLRQEQFAHMNELHHYERFIGKYLVNDYNYKF